MQTEIQELTGFNSVGRWKNKKQILLSHTSREGAEYVTSLKTRHNGGYKKVPHYLIRKDGRVFQLLDPETYSDYLKDYNNQKQTIVITLENLGWLKKNPLNASYINWIGNIYSEGVYERKWRGHFFWDPYTDSQMESLQKLVVDLCERFEIPKTCIGHNVKVDNVEFYEGIVTRSNYSQNVTDLSPAFDYEELLKVLENESV
jgi:N-acetyl-anhydromuramyl-L-alanine amidase AmpD